STSKSVTVTVDPVAQTPSLVAPTDSGNEGTPIALNIASALPANDVPTGALSLVISNVPAGASLNHGHDNGDGTWSLAGTDPAGFSGGNIYLVVTATDTEATSHTSATTAPVVQKIIVNTVAQAPTLAVAN